ncbi:MAG: papain-like cysteine protease family protein [Alphaproteobacteria bacterium]
MPRDRLCDDRACQGRDGLPDRRGKLTPVGVTAIDGTGPGPQYALDLDAAEISSALAAGNPVIVRGSSPRLGLGHYVLVVGTDAAGDFIAYDPWGGDEIRIDSSTWASAGSQAGNFTAISARRVVF